MNDRDDLLAQALALTALGDRAAFHRVYELSHRHLLGVAKHMLHRRDLAEELLQEVYVAVWQHAASRRDGGSAMAWLLSMVRNRAIDMLRSRARSGLEQQAEALDDTLPDQAGHRLDAAMAQARVAPCMETLSGQQRQSLALAFYQGLSHAEVASHLAVPLGTAKAWIHRGLAQLRRCLEALAP